VSYGNLLSRVPLVVSFNVATVNPLYYRVVAVDTTGNRSRPSAAVQSTVTLLDSQHIGTLTVTKVIGGTMTATWIVGGNIATGLTGQRTGLDSFGFYGYDSLGNVTFDVNNTSGDVFMRGTLVSGIGSDVLIVQPNSGSGVPEIKMYANATANEMPAYMNGLPAGGGLTGMGINSGPDQLSGFLSYSRQTTVKLFPTFFDVFMNTGPQHSLGPNQKRGAFFHGEYLETQAGLVQYDTGETQSMTRWTYNGIIEQVYGGVSGSGKRNGGFQWMQNNTHYVGFNNIDMGGITDNWIYFDSSGTRINSGQFMINAYMNSANIGVAGQNLFYTQRYDKPGSTGSPVSATSFSLASGLVGTRFWYLDVAGGSAVGGVATIDSFTGTGYHVQYYFGAHDESIAGSGPHGHDILKFWTVPGTLHVLGIRLDS